MAHIKVAEFLEQNKKDKKKKIRKCRQDNTEE